MQFKVTRNSTVKFYNTRNNDEYLYGNENDQVDLYDIVINDELQVVFGPDVREITDENILYLFDIGLEMATMTKKVQDWFYFHDGMECHKDCIKYLNYKYFNVCAKTYFYGIDTDPWYSIIYVHEEDEVLFYVHESNDELSTFEDVDLMTEEYIELIKHDVPIECGYDDEDMINQCIEARIPIQHNALSDEIYATTFEQLTHFPVSYEHDGILYKRCVIPNVEYFLTRYKVLCQICL